MDRGRVEEVRTGHILDNRRLRVSHSPTLEKGEIRHTLSILELDPERSCLSVEDRIVRSEFASQARQFADEIRVHVLGIPAPPTDTAPVKVCLYLVTTN